MLKSLWLDEGGAILSAELCLIMVLLVIGMVVGLTALRDAVDFQLADIAGAIAAIDPGYGWTGLLYTTTALTGYTGGAHVNGSVFASAYALSGTNPGAGMITVYTGSKDGVLTGP